MKKNQIILFAIVLAVTGALYAIVLANKKEDVKEKKGAETRKYISVRIIENQERSLTISSYGQIVPFTALDIAFEVSGRLQSGDLLMKPGTRFAKNDLLYKVNSEEMFYNLNARKEQLSRLIIGILPDISIDFNEDYDKWSLFLKDITPSGFLPNLPSFSSEKEALFISSKGIYAEYWTIKGMEERISKYIYLAPFNGAVSEIYTEPGAIINPGGRIAKVFNQEKMEVRLPISIDFIDKFQKTGRVTFYDANGQEVAQGKLLRASSEINKNTQSVDTYYSIIPKRGVTLLSGQYVTASIDNLISESVAVVPASAVKENEVYLLDKNELKIRSVKVISQKQDSIFVEGLKNTDTLVVEYITPSKTIKKYIGIPQQK